MGSTQSWVFWAVVKAAVVKALNLGSSKGIRVGIYAQCHPGLCSRGILCHPGLCSRGILVRWRRERKRVSN